MAKNSMLTKKSFASDFKILLVEPDKASRLLLTGIIEDLKPSRFLAAKSTAEARHAMSDRVEQFDCIILALKNPPSSGFHYLQEIRAGGIKRTPHDTKVILVSPPFNRAMVTIAKSLDLDGFISVPVTVASVGNTLSTALKRSRDLQDANVYGAVKLPKPVAKKAKEDGNKPTGPNARIVWSEKDREKAELLRSLKESIENSADVTPAVDDSSIENIRTFWLKDLLPGMILAEEITGEDDELLLSIGTVLNDNLIEKLKKFSELEICRSFLKAGSTEPE